jgi:hypothetical protein
MSEMLIIIQWNVYRVPRENPRLELNRERRELSSCTLLQAD